MEGKRTSQKSLTIGIVAVFFGLILGNVGLIGTVADSEFTGEDSRGSSEMKWTETTHMDFENGTLVDVVATTTGEVKLGLSSDLVEDEFTDETRISHRENLVADTVVGEVRLSGTNDLLINETFGGSNHDFGNTVQKTSDGGYVIVGSTGSYGVGFDDLWLIKTDGAGKEQWNRTFGASEGDYGMSVLQTSDNGYIILGVTASYGAGDVDVWLIKTDGAGSEEWNKTLGGDESDWGQSIWQTSDNGYIITGTTASFDAGGSDVWLIKTDDSGYEQWNRTFGGTEWDYGFSVQQASDGGYIMVGATDSYGAGDSDLWMIKTDAVGNEEWNRTFGGTRWDSGFSVEQTPDDGYITTGTTGDYNAGTTQLWLIKTDATGIEQWNRTFGGSGRDEGQTVEPTSDGGYLVAGATGSYGAGEMDIWLVKTDSSGIEQWNRTFGGSKWDLSAFHYFGIAVHQVSDNEYTVLGTTESYGRGDWDVWLIKANISGNLQGSLVSTNLLSGQGAYSIDAFRCTTIIRAGSGLDVQFSQDGLVWYDSNGNMNQRNTLSDGSNFIDLSGLGWEGYSLYYRMDFTSNIDNAPILQNVALLYSQYLQIGLLESTQFDSGTYPKWRMLNWSAATPSGTELKFQLRSGEGHDELIIEAFRGPDGSPATFYTASGQYLCECHERHRWLQYKAYLSTTDQSISPVLEEVSITYLPIDTDDDNIPDFDDLDDDNDGLTDLWESQYHLDPLDYSDSSSDPDFDTLTNFHEFLNETNPHDNDTDGDGLGDGFEITFSKTNPTRLDTNDNGIGDGLEFMQSQAYLGVMQSLPNGWIGISIAWENRVISARTNSSVLDGEFDKEQQRLELTVSGLDGSQGIVEIDIPKEMCRAKDVRIKLDGHEIDHSLIQTTTQCLISAEYTHSAHEISVNLGHVAGVPGGISDTVWYLIIATAVIFTSLVSLAVTKFKRDKENVRVQQLPPEILSILLEQKYSGGKMTKETYNDIKSLLTKYAGDEKGE